MASTQWFRPGGWSRLCRPDGKWNGNNGENYRFVYGNTTCDSAEGVVIEPEFKFDISRRFLQLAKLDNGGFERLNRYETALWRQVCQVIFTLDVLRRQNLDIKWLPRPTPPGRTLSLFLTIGCLKTLRKLDVMASVLSTAPLLLSICLIGLGSNQDEPFPTFLGVNLPPTS